MERIFRTILRLAGDDGFHAFQNGLVAKFYDVLGQGYSASENEVALVHRLVNAANGEGYGPFQLHAAMLHGTRSYVEFSYLDKPVTKELGDMALISIVTSGQTRLLQRLTIVQNKKSSGKSWGIDPEQLFLLKNFPPFAGNKGIFKGTKDLAFKNVSGCLGAYGLLASPGEMTLISAPLVAEMQRGKKSVSLADISVMFDVTPGSSGSAGWSTAPFFGNPLTEELFYVWRKIHRHGFPWLLPNFGSIPFLQNVRFSRDIYDIMRNFTQINIGEVTFASGQVLNANADGFSNLLTRSAGFEKIFEGGFDNTFGDRSFDGQMAVIIAHLDVGREG